MSGIKYYVLKKGEEPPEEFVVIKHVNGEPEFVASYINTDYLSYQNGVLLKFHERNDKLRAENAKLRELVDGLRYCANESHGRCNVRFVDGYVTCCPLYDVDSDTARCEALLRELGVEVTE